LIIENGKATKILFAWNKEDVYNPINPDSDYYYDAEDWRKTVRMTLREFWSMYRISEQARSGNQKERERAINILDKRSHIQCRKKENRNKIE